MYAVIVEDSVSLLVSRDAAREQLDETLLELSQQARSLSPVNADAWSREADDLGLATRFTVGVEG